MNKVLISGAGLAGLSAAINLAKEGYEVNVYEKNKDVGCRFHGDLQGLENWSEKDDILSEIKKMSIDINFDCDPFNEITATNGIKTNEITNLKKPLYYLVKRDNADKSIDFSLKEQALDAGVNIHFEKIINEQDADIVATGPILKNVVGVVKGTTFKTDLKDTATVLFNNEAAFKGYSYLLVTKGYGCMSSVLLDNFNKADACFRKTKEVFSNLYKFNMEEPRNCGGIGCFSIKGRYKKGKTLYVGEAAGLQDLFLGFGMRYALTSGFLAAKSIINHEDYGIMVKSCFEGKLKAGVVNRYLWEKFNRNNYSLAVNNFNWIINNFNWISNYNLFWRILYPFALKGMKNRYNWFK